MNTGTGPWHSVARTDSGNIRARNEDAFLDRPQKALWAVADGMGGHERGDLASQMIVSSLGQLLQEGSFDQRLREVITCLQWVNRRLTMELTQRSDCQPRIIGSTVIALLIEGSRVGCVWAGDSRCYLWRQGCLYQLSRDHALWQQLVDEQQFSVAQARAHPDAQALTRAIGAAGQLELSIVELEAAPGDVFLLCSDGLYQELDGEVMGQMLSRDELPWMLQGLCDQALQGRAADNLTAVVIRQ